MPDNAVTLEPTAKLAMEAGTENLVPCPKHISEGGPKCDRSFSEILEKIAYS